MSYFAERKKWKKAGKPYRSPERIKELHDICSECPLFIEKGGHIKGYDSCGKCGCNLHPENKTLNKLAWATTECPDTPAKWGPDV